jgi:hypothetical protein
VNAGIGTYRIPLRFNCRPEITVGDDLNFCSPVLLAVPTPLTRRSDGDQMEPCTRTGESKKDNAW